MKQKNTYFQRLTFSTNVTSLTSETLFCYIHEIGKCVFKRLTFSTNVASEGLVTFMKLENLFSQTNIFHKGLFTYYVTQHRWVGGLQNVTIPM